MLAEHKAKGESVFSGADAFKLYDTYGFPIDLTLEMAEDEGLSVDQDAFQQLMEEQRVRARKAREALGDLGWAGIEFGKDMPETKFLGYTQNTAEGKVLALVSEDEMQDTIGAGVEGIVVLDQTPFYAEMGGQVADHGTITCGEAVFEVTNVQKNKGGKYMHYGVAEVRLLQRRQYRDCRHRRQAAQGHLPQPLRRTSAPEGAADRAGRPCPSGRFPGRARPPAL